MTIRACPGVMPGSPHLVLSYISYNDGLIFRFSPYGFQDTHWIWILLVTLNASTTLAVFGLPTAHFIDPCTIVTLFYYLDKPRQSFFGISHNRHCRTFHFVHLGGINIYVDETSMGCKLTRLASDTVVETQPNTDNEIGFSNCAIDMRGAMHPWHT